VGPSRPLAEIATLESLKFQFRNCQACGLAETRNRLVFGVGHAQPHLLFIGEGPGADEDAHGLPFVGRAGALLTGLILASGLTREDVYITNMVKCRPPGNRNPEPAELDACRPILERQIELLQPRLIVTLGNVPLKALNPAARGITRERGHVFQYRDWPVLPTYHPSFLLRNPAALGECWQDFRQALALAYPEE
jgi:DNA polymerase